MTAVLIFSMAGTFVTGITGGLTAIREKLDVFGVVAVALICGLGGGVIRDLLVGRPPQTFRDWRYFVVLCLAGLVVLVDQGRVLRASRALAVLDSLGLAFFAANGSVVALDARLAVPQAVLLGTVSATGSSVLREILFGHVPQVLRSGLSGTTALIGAVTTTVIWVIGSHGFLALGVGAAAAVSFRFAAYRRDLALPMLAYQSADAASRDEGGTRQMPGEP